MGMLKLGSSLATAAAKKATEVSSSRVISSQLLQTTSTSSTFFSTVVATPTRKNVVVVDGVRLPFAMTSTIYEDQLAVDLQRLAFQGLLTKTALDKKDVDYIIAGTVIQEVRTSNIAREAAINAGFPASIGAHTVAMVREMDSFFIKRDKFLTK